MKILITGSKGMLGSDCRNVLGKEHEIIAPDRKELDIVSWDRVIEKIQHLCPDVVLNCAAFTDVDACEREPFAVRKVNVEGPRNLAQACARFDCKMIHISTDYIFSGEKPIPQPYFEDDSMDPISAYGRSKMESEVAVRDNAFDYIIVRAGWLYGINGKNFITSILNKVLRKKRKTLKVVNDQIGSPTWTYRLALQIRELINADVRGTYHASSEGYCSRLECAVYVLKKLKIQTSLEPGRLRDFKTGAKRPANCILENRLLKKQGLHIMGEWKDDLDVFLEQHGDDLIKRAKSGAS
ncbi:MAG: dTDP-4-dehydrorhamnose reductase [Deltaproteobacteria bacterium]|nr:dTDP-4-dehydrorhamnose reductase [Deltaproteobacteria bacterium]